MIKRSLNQSTGASKINSSNTNLTQQNENSIYAVALIADDSPLTLARITNLFLKRKYKIETFIMKPYNESKRNRIELTFNGTYKKYLQLLVQLEALVDVHHVN